MNQAPTQEESSHYSKPNPHTSTKWGLTPFIPYTLPVNNLYISKGGLDESSPYNKPSPYSKSDPYNKLNSYKISRRMRKDRSS